MARNALYIMCDQLRWDYLSCTGHPSLETPHIDALAARGMLFRRTYVQSPICGPSRMSCYTGRYVSSHGASWNTYPLKVGEQTLGDHLRPFGVRTAVCGKTHVFPDTKGMERLGISADSPKGRMIANGGFEPFDRDDGIHPQTHDFPHYSQYNHYLRAQGWPDDNPWHTVANSAEDDDGNILSGWYLENSDKAARVAEQDSETPYLTRRAMDFITDAGDTPWCLHLSYIKPHWPYIAPAPYNDMYGQETHLPVQRDAVERDDPNPIFAAFMDERVSLTFRDDATRQTVLTGYMGLIKQIDDQIGVLMAFLTDTGHLDDTMIVFTSDHGDYLGDHWMGEKELFHDASARVPLIVVDPDPRADATRGTVSDALVEAIDVVPTLLDYYGGAPKPRLLEGHSLRPILHGETQHLRDFVVSEYDYAMRDVRRRLNVPLDDARLTMIFDGRWKYIFAEGFDPMLYDLQTDPKEIVDLGRDPAFTPERDRMDQMFQKWTRRNNQQTTVTDADILDWDTDTGEAAMGILVGIRTPEELRRILK